MRSSGEKKFMRKAMPFIGFAVNAGFICAAAAAQAEGSSAVGAALGESRPIVDTRLRYEEVSQDPVANDAEALTLRARLGFETGQLWDTRLLLEGELVWPLDSQYNSTTNGKTQYPAVADPESYQINRLQLANTHLPQTTVTLGRQRIVLDDQRFVANVGWRQNEQTFDSLRIVNKSVRNLTVDVAYLNQVNRVFGERSVQGRYTGDSYLANVAWQFPIGKLSGYGYWLRFDSIAGVPAAVRDSSATYGVRFAGERPVSNVKLAYVAAYATQHEYADNPLRFSDDYYQLELTATYRQYYAGAGTEVLQGDGVKGFTTPLATLHKFQGWADKFLTTPGNGIDDRYLNLGFTLQAVGMLDTLAGQASYHDFAAQRISSDYGTEIDLQLQAKWRRFVGTVKYAKYTADQLFTATTKFWLQLEYAW